MRREGLRSVTYMFALPPQALAGVRLALGFALEGMRGCTEEKRVVSEKKVPRGPVAFRIEWVVTCSCCSAREDPLSGREPDAARTPDHQGHPTTGTPWC